eukprot:GHVS01001033.1.p1 GENE.GHVS01001033.1~~GHVS01001033.1.p1  ORF type:complete len:108 (+),score=8.43 GHVS01001033.1:249-572(+)
MLKSGSLTEPECHPALTHSELFPLTSLPYLEGGYVYHFVDEMSPKSYNNDDLERVDDGFCNGAVFTPKGSTEQLENRGYACKWILFKTKDGQYVRGECHSSGRADSF